MGAFVFVLLLRIHRYQGLKTPVIQYIGFGPYGLLQIGVNMRQPSTKWLKTFGRQLYLKKKSETLISLTAHSVMKRQVLILIFKKL